MIALILNNIKIGVLKLLFVAAKALKMHQF